MTLAEQFDALTLDDLNGYVAEGQEEHIYLDFKKSTGQTLAIEMIKRIWRKLCLDSLTQVVAL